MPLPVEVIEDEWHGIRAPSTDLPDSNYSKGLLFLIFTACFVSRRIHVEGEEARRLTVKMVQKFLDESMGGRGSCGVSWCPHWLHGSIWWRCSFLLKQFSSVQLLRHVQLFCDPMCVACQASLSITSSWSLLKLMSIDLVMPSNHLIHCHPLLLLLWSFPASGSFQMSQFFTSGGQSIGVSASTLVLPMNIQDWFPLGWTGWISLQSKGLSRVFSNTTVQKHQFFSTQRFL